MISETIIRVKYEGIIYDLDIDSNIPLRVDISNVENQRIGSFFGVGSQTFDLPGTKTNNQFFKHAYDVGATEIPAFYNSIPGYIITNGETVLDGQFQLLEIITDQEGYVTYKCRITDQVITFNDVLADKLIQDADWSYLNHTLNYTNIIDSWDTPISGGVFYPLAFYGFNDPTNTQLPWLAYLPTGVTSGNYLDNSLTPLQAQQFLPAVKVKDTLDVIFDQVGYRYTGTFQDTKDFDKLYILPKAQEGLGITGESGQIPLVNAYQTGSSQSIPPPVIGNTSNTDLNINAVSSDPLNVYDTANKSYSANLAIGNYTFTARTSFWNPCYNTGAAVEVTLQILVGNKPFSGTVIAQETLSLTSSDGFNFFTIDIGGAFNITSASDVWVRITYKTVSGTPSNLVPFAYLTFFSCIEAPQAVLGNTVNMGLQFGGNTKSIDVLNGLIKKFNLILTPVKGDERTIRIDTFDDWIRSGRIKDWTNKYNTATRISINHTVDEQPKELILSDVEDVDRFSKQAKESDPYRQYGSLRIIADNNVSVGEKKIGEFFAPVIPAGPFRDNATGAGTAGDGSLTIDTSVSLAVPHLYKFENGKTTSYAFKPRIGYKVESPLPKPIYIGADGGGTTLLSGDYATLANVSDYPASTTSRNLWFNPSYTLLSYTNNLGGGVSAFESYWKTYLDSLYWENSVKVTIDLQFNQNEYYDIRLNDKIFIKDTFYRINKMSGFNITEDDVTTVELIKLYPAYFDGIEAQDCSFAISGVYSPDNCVGGPTPTPFPTATPASTPTPTSTPSTEPVPPTPTPTPGATIYKFAGRACDPTYGSLIGIYSTTNYSIGSVVTVLIGGQERCFRITATSTSQFYEVVNYYGDCTTCLTANPSPTPTPAGNYYAVFESCNGSGFTIQVFSPNPIPTNYVIGIGRDCYTYLIPGGNGANGQYENYVQYSNCLGCEQLTPI